MSSQISSRYFRRLQSQLLMIIKTSFKCNLVLSEVPSYSRHVPTIFKHRYLISTKSFHPMVDPNRLCAVMKTSNSSTWMVSIALIELLVHDTVGRSGNQNEFSVIHILFFCIICLQQLTDPSHMMVHFIGDGSFYMTLLNSSSYQLDTKL